MEVEREAIVERLCYAMVKAVELRLDLRAIDELMDFSTDPQEAVDSALHSATNIQIRLINAITMT